LRPRRRADRRIKNPAAIGPCATIGDAVPAVNNASVIPDGRLLALMRAFVFNKRKEAVDLLSNRPRLTLPMIQVGDKPSSGNRRDGRRRRFRILQF